MVLFTRPKHNLETKYLHYFSDGLIKEIKSIGEVTPIDLEGKNANRLNLEKALRKVNPRLVILNGHGTKEYIYGHNDEIILDENNINILDSKIIYAVVCDSNEGLGKISITNGGADSFIGYGAQFMIITDPTCTTSPARDKNCHPFKQVYVMLIASLLAGLTVKESIEKTKDLTRKLIREYGVYGIRDKYGDAPLIRLGLFWDMYFLNANGNLDTIF